MISRHIDLLAIGLILAGIAFVTQARRSAVIEYHSARLVELANHQIQPLLARPHVPRLCVTRD